MSDKKVDIEELLAEIAVLRETVEQRDMNLFSALQQVVPPEYSDDMKIMFNSHVAHLEDTESSLAVATDKVKVLAVEYGKPVTFSGLTAGLNKGRVSYDTAALDGYAVANPEIKEFRKQGSPYCVIRKAK